MNYILSLDAEEDLVDIYDYSLGEWGEAQADRYIEGFYASFLVAGAKPLLGRLRQELGDGIRSRLYQSHVIFYMEWDGGIAIIRVFHQARDIDDELFESIQRFTGEN
ncbi:type II toxin-antitoxin system RelE/ParE family toxin [Rhizobium sp. TH2]|uniref:type II toxin-antitoxin system RelE/ParE family toxin n=1 Tax=Rhizobium sp. TH2 TaxID=2775403 RepID=UPI0021584F65|nr:type II toxin-antitoxin system RelE/ParE family toxin [Rhizobium sp. TH2]UVC11562.1 type II toxin-antitoxin system RelE/ParE family toxin [Rhizobium sp. TH2]